MPTTVNGAIDVRLLRTLLILLRECSVSRTAEILGQTQPTISQALKRLRELLKDPLLVRSGGKLVPTERGMELREAVPHLLEELTAYLSPATSFDPQNADRRFRIVANNCLGSVLLPRLFSEIGRRAPRARLEVVAMPSFDKMLTDLAMGSIDLVVGNWPQPPEHLRMAPLLTSDIVCLVRAQHPLAKLNQKLSMERYLAENHISPTLDQPVTLSPIDGRLAELGIERRIAASVPEYAIVPHVLAQSDLMFTTGAPFAEQIAQSMPFALLEAPSALGKMHFYLLWHDCKHHSPAHAWLRQVVKEVAAELRQILPACGESETAAVPAPAE